MDIQELQNQVNELMEWKRQRIAQQIVYPLDINSIKVINKYFMRIVSQLTTVGGASGHETTEYLGQQDKFEFTVAKNYLLPYTVNVSTNFISTIGFFDNDRVINVSTTDTPPSPLVAGVDYYVINSTGSTFQLSSTSGGVAINILDEGSGRQFLYSFGF